MHLKIDSKAVEALKSLRERVRAVNGFANKRWGTVASRVISRFAATADLKEIEALARDLSDTEAFRKSLLERLDSLTKGAGEKTIYQLERSVLTLTNSGKAASEKTRKTSEKSIENTSDSS